jgi:hypothetical protein
VRPRLVAPLLAALLVLVGAACSSGGSDGLTSDLPLTSTDSGAPQGTTTTGSVVPPTSVTTTSAPATTSTTKVDDPADDAYVDAWATGLTTGKLEDGQLVLDERDGPCVAQAWVDIVTVDGFRYRKVEPDALRDPGFSVGSLKLSQDQAEAFVDAFDQCNVEWVGLLATSLGTDLDPADQACIQDAIDQDKARRLLVGTFADSPDANAAFEDLLNDIDSVCQITS